MELPILDEPRTSLPRLPASAEQWAFGVKCAAMRPHIEGKWGWDEDLQRRIHRDRYASKPFFAIEQAATRLGTLSLEWKVDHLRFGEFYLPPEYQRRGLGGAVLVHCLRLADELTLPVRLEYLKWNPVGSLYERYGFKRVGDSDIHYFMERPAARP